jgi:3-hydroxybutyryl-CoA dehydrogenase
MTDIIAVIGAGQMGSGIAHVSAAAGIPVTMIDVSADALAKGKASIEKNFERQIKKGTVDAATRDAALAKLTTSTDLGAIANATFVIEAATENVQLKFKIFGEIDRLASAGAILATNTSSISITEIAAKTKRPEHVIGMHFMNPVPVMQLVEIIRGLATSPETLQRTLALATSLGKTPCEAHDYPGFIANRLMEGVGTTEAIDTVMKLGMNHPMGPLALADLIGLDTCLAILEVLHDGLGDSKYRACPLLRQYVAAGWLGRKSGRGFYTYA